MQHKIIKHQKKMMIKNNHKLNEGLRVGDLQGVVLPLVSIDEYKPKIGNNDQVLVAAFFLEDKSPGEDFVRFIKKGAIDIVDCELSNIPDEEGYWVVWIEVARDEAQSKIFNLLYSLRGITGIDKWQFKPYGIDKIYDMTPEKLKSYLKMHF